MFSLITSSCQISGNWQESVRDYNTSPSIKAGLKIFENVRLAKLLKEAYRSLWANPFLLLEFLLKSPSHGNTSNFDEIFGHIRKIDWLKHSIISCWYNGCFKNSQSQELNIISICQDLRRAKLSLSCRTKCEGAKVADLQSPRSFSKSYREGHLPYPSVTCNITICNQYTSNLDFRSKGRPQLM